jgi:hypothetical protein
MILLRRPLRALDRHGVQKKDLLTRGLSLVSEKSFWFDFGRPRHSITEDEFETVFNHLNFDKCLSYVSFRRGEIKLGPKSSYADKSLRGRQDMLFLFGWLTRRGVERILSVIVEDDGLQAHSDEAIEQAIGSFKVEVLDWKKPDLDAGVLHRVGHHLREVHLQWSGNNSALRAWGGPCGLRAIPTLKKVYLYVCQAALSTSQVYQVKSPSQVKSSQVKSYFSRLVKSSR